MAKAPLPQTDFKLIGRLYEALQDDSMQVGFFKKRREIDPDKIVQLIAEWREKNPHLDLATYHYRGGASIFRDSILNGYTELSGLFLAEVSLVNTYSDKVVTPLLDAGIKSVGLIPIYLRNAIASNNAALCERVLDAAQEYKLDANNINIGRFTPLSYAAFCTKPDCIRTLAKRGAKPSLDVDESQLDRVPLVALQESKKQDKSALIASFEALIDIGESVHFHRWHCTRIHSDASKVLRGHFIRHGLNLNAFVGEPNNPVWTDDSFTDPEKQGIKAIFPFDRLPRDTTNLIDIGVIVLPSYRRRCMLIDVFNTEKFLPFKRSHIEFLDSATGQQIKELLDYSQIDRFLEDGLRAENLACRCFSFGLLDKEMFEHILQAENKQRAKVGDAALSAEQFFNRLPPFVRADEALTAIKQTIDKTHAATSGGIGEIRMTAKTVGLE